jgi:hypothetical protein
MTYVNDNHDYYCVSINMLKVQKEGLQEHNKFTETRGSF